MEPNLSQALHLLNGDATHQRIQRSPVIKRLLDQKTEPREILNALYLRTLGREPTTAEANALGKELAAAGNRKETHEILNDIFWALLNSKEFLFNH